MTRDRVKSVNRYEALGGLEGEDGEKCFFFRYLFFFILMVLSCVTFNARGLMDMGKFERVKEKCKGDDVIALQETNWKESVMRDYKKKWEGDILYNNGDGRLGRRF